MPTVGWDLESKCMSYKLLCIYHVICSGSKAHCTVVEPLPILLDVEYDLFLSASRLSL